MAARDLWEQLLTRGWDELQQWRVNQMPEGLHLDFKQAALVNGEVRDTDRKNLAKGISGFANTEGGILVYGAETTRGPAKEDLLNRLEGVTPLDVYAEKLRAYVQTITTPVVPGVDVKPFADPTRPNTGVVGVFTPITDGGPYRAEGPLGDVAGKYFIRTTTDTTVMSHQLLASMFGRSPHPRLRAGFRRSDGRTLLLFVENIGRGAADAAFVRLRFDGTAHQVFDRGSWVDKRFDVAAGFAGGPDPHWKLAFALPPGALIYPGEARNVAAFDLPGEQIEFTVRLDCKNAQPVQISQRVNVTADAIAWVDLPRD